MNLQTSQPLEDFHRQGEHSNAQIPRLVAAMPVDLGSGGPAPRQQSKGQSPTDRCISLKLEV